MARAKLERSAEAPVQRPMPTLARFNAGALPSSDMKKFTEQVNLLIEKYNKTPDEKAKKQILKDIQAQIQQIDYKYPPSHFVESLEYHDARATLFKEIRYQYASLGSPSLLDASLKKPSSLAEIIANMSPEKADKLAGILLKGGAYERSAFRTLYDADDQSAEAKAFRQFYHDHQIAYLGGVNSKNFTITGIIDNNVEILKLDYRLNTPRHVEAHLRRAHSEHFAPIAAERQTLCFDPENQETISRTLMATEFCEQGSLLDHRVSLSAKKATLPQLTEHTGKIFQQMAGILLDIQKANGLFSDAKLSNWLINKEGTVRIADTKSFLFTDAQGKYSRSLPQNQYMGLMSTDNYEPPEFEFSSHQPLSSDAIHAYILGKNLYLYTSGKIPEGHNGADFNFSSNFFKTPEGQEYQALIKALIKPNPAERMSVQDAMERLFIINSPDFKTVFEDLHHLKFGKNDTSMNEYIREKQQQINQAPPDERANILQQLQATVIALKNDKATEKVRAIIQDFRRRATEEFLAVGMNDKADRIENAMTKVPIEARAQFLTSGKSFEVMRALASHHHLGRGGKTYLTNEGSIDIKEAAKSFKDFKKVFQDQVADKPAKQAIEVEQEESPLLKH